MAGGRSPAPAGLRPLALLFRLHLLEAGDVGGQAGGGVDVEVARSIIASMGSLRPPATRACAMLDTPPAMKLDIYQCPARSEAEGHALLEAQRVEKKALATLDGSVEGLVDMDAAVSETTRPDISGCLVRIVKAAGSHDVALQADAHGVQVISRGEGK